MTDKVKQLVGTLLQYKYFLTEEKLSLPTSHISIVRWNQEISEIHTNQILNKNNYSTFFTLGIMMDESMHETNQPDFQLLEMKDLTSCTGKSVA
ncbi:17238_t:CDS:2 [Cetraspora pellucida]|uniref:17238_t:CDS:1 n=1 Tax=Cetraspora pellucida TaxID=1433469 RepID=A0A9N9GND2_9GLOM|nr:17238_t:CDS:2 [Cetraspora pellucida]